MLWALGRDAALLIGGICVFAFVFGINSAINSFLIAKYSSKNSASKNMGFYYMSNAVGRLYGTLVSGLIYSAGDVEGEYFAWCFWVASASVVVVALVSLPLRDGGRLNCGPCIGCCGSDVARGSDVVGRAP